MRIFLAIVVCSVIVVFAVAWQRAAAVGDEERKRAGDALERFQSLDERVAGLEGAVERLTDESRRSRELLLLYLSSTPTQESEFEAPEAKGDSVQAALYAAYDRPETRAGTLLSIEDLNTKEAAFIDEYNRRAYGTGYEIPESAGYVRSFDAMLGAIQLVDAETGEEVEFTPELEELAELQAEETVVKKLLYRRATAAAKVHPTREDAEAYAVNELQLEDGFSVMEAGDGFAVIHVREVESSPELERIRDHIGQLQEEHGVRVKTQWFGLEE